jgi:hypothetical protein
MAADISMGVKRLIFCSNYYGPTIYVSLRMHAI